MKYLFLFLSLISGCCGKTHSHEKFTFGQKVKVINGFYSGIEGTITAYTWCMYKEHDDICYKISYGYKDTIATDEFYIEEENIIETR